VLIVDGAALLLAILGFHMAFRQRLVRNCWRALRGRPAVVEARPREEDPARSALLIFGMMLFAFALIVAGFVTAYALFS
jgi:cytochrome b561